ncbi:hypothetical protein A2U01_0064719, partial [Trifolium medium]|nr:hypothetical protein [Trifolium medium]
MGKCRQFQPPLCACCGGSPNIEVFSVA